MPAEKTGPSMKGKIDRTAVFLAVTLLAFFLVNMLQAAFTSISRDEAYYWMYAQNLDWGYFDHPPMVALFIWIGTRIAGGTLGVRLLAALLASLTLFIVWKLLPEEDRKKEQALPVFFAVALSMPIFNIYGFITTPDVPLLFFSALYLYVFLQFTRAGTVFNALKVGVAAALLMYSKYHGAFLIIFSLIPHYRLLFRWPFYLAGLVGILLFLPHIYWQYQHEFISFRYHLFQRTDGFMGGKHILNYVLNAIVILNPFLFGLFLYDRFIAKQKSTLPVMFRFVMWGFLLFFAFTSFRDHIEPQWIGVAAIPLTLLLVDYLLRSGGQRTYLKTAALVSILIVLVLRVGLVLPLELNTEFHTQKASYYNKIREYAAASRVMFINSYSDAARYTYYTGEPAFSYNCYDYRKNQYDIWPYEDTWHREQVFLSTGYAYSWADSTVTVEGKLLYYMHIPGFPMLNKTTGEILGIDPAVPRCSIQKVSFSVKNPYDYPIVFNDTMNPVSFWMVYQTGRTRYLSRIGTEGLSSLGPGQQLELSGYYYPDAPAGDYELAIGIQPGRMSPLLITEKMTVSLSGDRTGNKPE